MIRKKHGGELFLHWSKLSPMVVILCGLAFVSVLWAPYKDVAIQGVVTFAMYGVFFHLIWQRVRSVRDIRVLIMIILGMGTFQAVLGVIQYWGLGSYRAYGTFFNPNFFGTYQVCVISLVLALLCYSDGSLLGKGERVVLISIGILSVSAFLLARSRGASIALICVVAFIGIMRFGKMVMPFLLTGVLLLAVVPNPVRDRGLEVAAHDPFSYTRIDIWKNSIDRIINYPWGVGLGMYKYLSFQFRFPVDGEIARFGKRAESAHNEYLQIAVELGITGLLIFLAGTILWMKEAVRILLGEQTSLRSGAIAGLAGIVLTVLVHASIDSVFHEPALVLLMILSGSMVLVLGRIQADADPVVPKGSIHLSRGRSVIAAIIMSIFVSLTVQSGLAWYAFERGNAQTSFRKIAEASQWYQVATTIQPWNAAYHNAVASSDLALFHTLGELGLVLDAVKEIKLCMSLNALDGRYPYRLGTLYQLLAELARHPQERIEWLSRAMASYQVATTRDPYSPASYVALGKLQRVHGSLQEAQASFSKAIEYEPNYLPARALRMEVALQLGNANAAHRDYSELLAIMEKYQGRARSPMEHQFLDVNLDALKEMLRS
ncbi:MAG: O-antigen ligase family protein [Nitrospira sp.]|nr:O-antigen ligase family protein [Nitrospira sp.]